ncbi:MAG: asparagine synthase (glutamine-hydrolyzing) [Rhodospirillales bacterium]|nr:asparagine synthase (glutamine-hydrolyzing) [Rhodospirillales bacterium]
MCGIAGLFLPEHATGIELDMDAMLSAIAHRGPDDEGRHMSEDRRFQAGFRRLAIIDLETGDQPIVDDSGGRVLVGNGEIYNYKELRAQYPAYPYQSQGDMEAVLAAHAAKGDAFFEILNGMYALALYEKQGHRLTLVRDRLGIKPLYWCELPGGGVLFASEIKALLASGLVKSAVDEAAIASHLIHGYVPAPQTIYKGIRQLPPGHVLCTDASGNIKVEPYWHPTPAADLPGDPEAIKKHLTELLGQSVKLQLRSDVPLGVLLSGGIDSGLLAALAAEHSAQPLNTFTVRFEGASFDESPLAEAVAARYGTNHTTVDLPSTGAGEHLCRLAWYADEPLNDPALLPNFLIEEALGKSLKVSLNGTGGDELFAGYMRYFQTPIESSYLKVPGWLRHGLIEPAVATVSPMNAWRLKRAEKFNHDPGGYVHDHTTFFAEPMLRLIGNKMPLPDPAQVAFANSYGGPGQSAMLAADISTYLAGDLLSLLDRTSMAVGVEGRVPFLDHRLVEAALAVPPEIRTPGNRQKGLERLIAEKYLPSEILDAPKRGFASPVPAWMQAGLGQTVYRLLTRKSALDRGWWTKPGIDALCADFGKHAFRLYHLAMLEMAVRIHVEDTPTGQPPTRSLEDYADAA